MASAKSIGIRREKALTELVKVLNIHIPQWSNDPLKQVVLLENILDGVRKQQRSNEKLELSLDQAQSERVNVVTSDSPKTKKYKKQWSEVSDSKELSASVSFDEKHEASGSIDLPGGNTLSGDISLTDSAEISANASLTDTSNKLDTLPMGDYPSEVE